MRLSADGIGEFEKEEVSYLQSSGFQVWVVDRLRDFVLLLADRTCGDAQKTGEMLDICSSLARSHTYPQAMFASHIEEEVI